MISTTPQPIVASYFGKFLYVFHCARANLIKEDRSKQWPNFFNPPMKFSGSGGVCVSWWMGGTFFLRLARSLSNDPQIPPQWSWQTTASSCFYVIILKTCLKETKTFHDDGANSTFPFLKPNHSTCFHSRGVTSDGQNSSDMSRVAARPIAEYKMKSWWRKRSVRQAHFALCLMLSRPL